MIYSFVRLRFVVLQTLDGDDDERIVAQWIGIYYGNRPERSNDFLLRISLN